MKLPPLINELGLSSVHFRVKKKYILNKKMMKLYEVIGFVVVFGVPLAVYLCELFPL